VATLNSNARNTASEVKEIFETDLTNEKLHNWINMAAETTDDIAAADEGGDLSSQRLKLIEANLAAYYAMANDPRVKRETVGDATFTYDRTDYWEAAVNLDNTGYLSIDSGKPQASISVLDGRNIE